MNKIFRLSDKQTKGIFDIAAMIFKDSPYRITGSEDALRAGEAIKALYSKHCHKSMLEKFAVYPGQLWDIGRILSSCYLTSAILMFAGRLWTVLASVILFFGLLYGTVHFFMYGSLFDRLFAKKEARNAVGITEPLNGPTSQMIIAAHHDSAYVSRFLSKNQVFYKIQMLSSILFYILSFLASIYFSILYLIGEQSIPNMIFSVILLTGSIPAVLLFFFISNKPSPGIGDDLIGSAITAGISEIFSTDPGNAGIRLDKTRLIFLSTDAEEAGQRGARSYISRHRKDMSALPTHFLNIDSIYDIQDLTLLTRDRNWLTVMPIHTIKKYEDICSMLGYNIKKKGIPPGGGGTDGAWFSFGNIQAATIIAMPMKPGKEKIYNHTADDTIDKIDPKTVKAVSEIAVNYILDLDRQ
jgi:hypothetical protein